MGLSLVTPPAVEPVTADDLTAHLRIFDTTEIESVLKYGIAARQTMESSRYPGLGICLITQTWALTLDAFPDFLNVIEIPKPPLQSITSIQYTDTNGNVSTMDPSTYIVDTTAELGPGTGPARISPKSNGWPNVNPGVSLQQINGVKITFVAGFGDDETTVPVNLQIALMMLAATHYESREATGDSGNPKPLSMAPFGYDALTGLYRATGIA